jgi:hypothetical protein
MIWEDAVDALRAALAVTSQRKGKTIPDITVMSCTLKYKNIHLLIASFSLKYFLWNTVLVCQGRSVDKNM